ncbi:MucB/RseB C-terminal domain-containing protein [Halomonas sp. M20]|uniref:MucB/RseB C-terminal domain-containing protein n=1 Tax=Halomonas sp. M20 TaxID=2763264 RepID=UPI001D09B530|nr:MucB/RseB C-terminal domain-containing protein [Halomonas sp. M20]
MSASENSFDCRQLADNTKLASPLDWLERSMMASQCYMFRAQAIRISAAGVRTLALAHEIHDGVVREVTRYLDGPAVIYERYGRLGRNGILMQRSTNSSPAFALRGIDRHYRLTLGDEERVAGRLSMRLDIEPRDELRYGHRLWLDSATGLPLKQNLVDAEGNILETFQMTELIEPRLYSQVVPLEPLQDMPSGPWQPGWIPAGYAAVPLLPTVGVSGKVMSHRLYTDGLSSFSLFVQPLKNDHETLLPGIHRLGVSHAAVRHLRLDKAHTLQVVVLGELPPKVLYRIASRMQYQGNTGRDQQDSAP